MTTWRLQYLISCGLALSLFPITSPAITLPERPAYNDYTNAVSMGTWCGKAVEERGNVLGDTNAFLPKVSSQQGIVIGVKQNIQSRYPSYIKAGITDVSGVLNTYGIQGLVWSNDVAFLTYCGLDANYFGETPYFNMQYPAELNGWTGCRIAISNLIITLQGQGFPDFYDGYMGVGYADTINYSYSDWTLAYNAALADYEYSEAFYPMAIVRQFDYDGYGAIYISIERGAATLSNFMPNVGYSASVFAYVDTNVWYAPLDFNNEGDSVITRTGYNNITNFVGIGANYITYGSTNKVFSQPIGAGLLGDIYHGYVIDSGYVFYDFRQNNGFQFK